MSVPERIRPGRRPEGTRWSIGFVARAAVVAIVLWALASMIWLARDLLFVAFFAVLVASFLSIFVTPLARSGMPRGLAVPIVVLSFIALGVGAFVLAWPALQDQLAILREQLPEATVEATEWVRERYREVAGQFQEPNADFERELRRRINEEAADIVAGALPLLNTVVGAIVGVVIVLFAGLYLTVEPRQYVRGVLRLLPPQARSRAGSALTSVGTALREWMLGTVISMAIIAAVTTLGLWLIDIPAPFALGVIAGGLEFVPYFGPIVSALPAIAVGLTISPAKALWVIVLYTGIQQLEGNLVYPLVMRGVVELPPALTILFQSLMAVLFGFLGLLLAVPILASAKVLIERLYIEPMEAMAP